MKTAVRCAATVAALALIALGAAAAASAQPAAEHTICCLKVTIDVSGAFVADYGQPGSDSGQRVAGRYLVDWEYHVRGIARYVESGGRREFLFLWQGRGRNARPWAVYAARLEESDLLQDRGTSGWYPDDPGTCREVDLSYRPFEADWGNLIDAPGLRAEDFNPTCGGTQPYDAGLFGRGRFGDYRDFVLPFPSAHVKQLRGGTMHASTVCTDWKQSEPGAFPYAFRGYMTEKVTLDSFASTGLKAKGKALAGFLGKQGEAARGFVADPAGYFDAPDPMHGRTGCHAP